MKRIIKNIIRRLINIPRKVIRIVNEINTFKAKKFNLIFEYDNKTNIKINKFSLWKSLLNAKYFDKLSMLNQRIHAEPLLRQISEIIVSQLIDSNSVIIDIGSWIGDNSLPWAKMIGKNGLIIAIDPSSENLSFIRNIAEINSINNIVTVNEVCSDNVLEKLTWSGDISHTSFVKINNQEVKRIVYSTTLDEIYKEKLIEKPISLIHLDVEGFELKVLKGALNIIKLFKPIIIFEVHISRDLQIELFDFLHFFDYEIYMVNEVILGNNLDCRNFLAFPSHKLNQIEIINGRNFDIKYVYHALIGDNLIHFPKII